jgi:hypothetical protein
MRTRILSIITFLCLGAFSAATATTAGAAGTVLIPGSDASPELRIPEGIPMPPDPVGAAICWRDEAGFLLRLPEGWQNVQEAAEKFQLCFMGIPAGTNFNDAPVTLYPRIFNRSADQTPAQAVDAAAQAALKALSRVPGGEKMTVRKANPFTTRLKLPVRLRYFDNGPFPNVFTVGAYVTYQTTVLGLILSAKTREARADFLPALRRVADGVYPLQVKSQRPQGTRE